MRPGPESVSGVPESVSGVPESVRGVPEWSDLPAEARSALASRGLDGAWYGGASDRLRLTVLNLHVKLESLGLWRFIAREDGSGPGCLHFRCADLPGLLAALRGLSFTKPHPDRAFWEAREKRAFASLHLKHFPGWPADRLQFHLDRHGFWLRWWWWLLPPFPLAMMALHAAGRQSYREVADLRRILLRQGADPRVLGRP